ncbi:MAG: hypothetical protein R2749_06255 [Acidimicrobiales bacterium]
MAEVSEKLLNQFVQNLETKVLAQPAAEATPAATGEAKRLRPRRRRRLRPSRLRRRQPPPPRPPRRRPPTTGRRRRQQCARSLTEPVEPVDLLGATGSPLIKRLAPVVGALFALLVASRVLRRRRRRG